ncbi:hypothetical protein DFH09DRAFT_1102431 [Mycena vulgaris]|nr:hypothetical protein DFH09DRAFT_1102431 [Mycena vulgaris]
MVIGISATFIQLLVDCTALDPADKRFRISLNLRRTITVGQILQMIDFPHLRNVGVLQFIQALATYIPDAAIYKPELALRYKTRCRKRQVPLAKSDIHTLASSGKNEAYIPELKDALLDFLNQLGQTEKDFDNRLWFGGGDGYISNATHFTELADLNQLPSFEELEIAAKHLYDTYTSTVAQREAATDARDGQSPWAANVQSGKSWIPLAIDATSASVPKQKKKRNQRRIQYPKHQRRNRCLLRLPFRSTAIRSSPMGPGLCEMHQFPERLPLRLQLARQDVMMINFAGSGHSRYLGYLLEMSCDLELESSPALRNATLDSTVCNPSGKAGGSQACDIFQERMNRELEPIIQRKDTDYGSDHVRNMWSRNLKDIYDLKADLRDSVGLAKRSGRHKEPHAKPEVKILLKHYKDVELHHRRPGRTYTPGESALVDNFTAGIKKLQEGGLSKWVRRTTMDRGLLVEVPDEDSSSESDSDDSEDGEEPEMTPGLIHAFDGEVVVDLVDEIDFSGAEEEDTEA